MTINTFNFNGQEFRSTMIDGEPWFCGSDVLHILYGQAGGNAHHYDKVGPEERQKVKPIHFQRKGHPATVISESGLYKLIMRSDKKTALPFQDWVTKEVLPSIRKTGGYLLNEAARTTAHADTKEAMPDTQASLRVTEEVAV